MWLILTTFSINRGRFNLLKLKSKKRIYKIIFILGVALFIFGIICGFVDIIQPLRGIFIIIGVLVGLISALLITDGNGKRHTKVITVVFMFPIMLAFICTKFLPFVMGVFYSLTDWNGIKFDSFVGISNYINSFKGGGFQYSFLLTAIYAVLNMIAVNVLGFFLALICVQKIKRIGFFRASFFLPNMIGGIVLGYVWQFIFNKVFVVLFDQVSMLSSAKTAIFAIAIVSTWQYAGYIMMIYIAGLQSVPGDILEAASVDGASGWKVTTKIRIPMMANTFTNCVFLSLLQSFDQFDLNFAITNGAPAVLIKGKVIPSTQFLSLNIYNTAMIKNDYGVAQAQAIMFFLILTVLSLTQVSIMKKWEVTA